MLGKVLGLILFVVLAVGFNTVAVMIVASKNPILGGGYDFFTGKWKVVATRTTWVRRCLAISLPPWCSSWISGSCSVR